MKIRARYVQVGDSVKHWDWQGDTVRAVEYRTVGELEVVRIRFCRDDETIVCRLDDWVELSNMVDEHELTMRMLAS